ncbi:hypothetical protein DFH94DRAFT_184318 [Russula ochroleuca]|uniref:C2H2-type domain-containing protein n=1 Tax=Russula ochroleuca TaxID=152965 RepID=A0A9P5N581_9AGAM|nr:hypothetical protein DFH94DRAFT_184318 [Russula ochroleuca]
MAQPQPIIHPPVQDDHPMPSPSDSSFNPASYTRAFFGSPISWRPGSFGNGNRYFPGPSPDQLLSPLDPTDIRDAGKISSSIESDRDSIMNALSAIDREDELVRNYSCCGLELQDLHALVEHFEECHVVVDPCSPSSSRVASPVAAQGQTQASYRPLSAQASTSASASSSPSPTSTPHASTILSRHASSLLLSKPFRCPKPYCNKSYKQANGLKYHMTHGSCNFAPPKDLEALQALLAEKGVVVNGNDRSGVQIKEGELREVEREAERRLRPFACSVGDCQRRYKNMNGLRYHYQRSGDHGAIGLQLLASGQHECLQHSKSAAVTCQTTPVHSATTSPISPSPTDSAGSRSSTQEHVATSQSSRIPTPPDKLHPSLSCWIKNMNKLSSLIDRLQELASSAPAEQRAPLLRQVVALRSTSKKQHEHFMEFLQLSEEYANKYLLDISAEIQQQSSFLDKLERRLEAAKKLRGEAVDLQMFYQSGTVAIMENLRATVLSRPLPEDDALFSEVDLLLTEIRRCYVELDKFWTEEIYRASEALKMRRVDPTDFERWRNFQANLKQTIDSWKNEKASGDAQILRRNNACLSEPTLGR